MPVARSLSGTSMFAITWAREREPVSDRGAEAVVALPVDTTFAGSMAVAPNAAVLERPATGSDRVCGVGDNRLSAAACVGRGDAGRKGGGAACAVDCVRAVAGFTPCLPLDGPAAASRGGAERPA